MRNSLLWGYLVWRYASPSVFSTDHASPMGLVCCLALFSESLYRKVFYPRTAPFVSAGSHSFASPRILGRRGPGPGRAWGQAAPDRPLAAPGRPRPTRRPPTCQPAGRTPSAATRTAASGRRPTPPPGGTHPTLALAQRLPWVEGGRNDAETRGLNTLLCPLPGP